MKTTMLITILALSCVVQLSANTWECIGPDGGHFVGSITNPANVNEVIAITSYQSPTAVFHSMDGGKTWSKRATTPCEGYIAKFYPFDFSRLYLLHHDGCYYSTDSGIT